MIPEFKFKSKDTYQKKQELKKFLKEKLADRKVRFTGAVSVAALGIMLIGFTALAGPDKETTKKESVTALLQTAGVTTQINTKENQLQEEIKKVSISKKEDAAMTGMTLASAAGVDVSAVTEDSVEEEIAAEAASEAVLAATSQQAVAPAEPEPEPAQPAHPQLVGFTNPGIANVEQYVNIRVEPNENATICGKLGKNAGCEILSENNGWYEIITNGVQGYIKSEFLITGEEAWQLADQLKYAYVRVITETLYVREQPNTESGIIELASLDQKLALLEEQPEWVKVQIDGKEGYMNKSYIAIEYTLPKGEAVEVEKKETKEEKEKEKDKDKNSKSKSKSSSSSSKPAKDCSSVVSYAKQFVGNPYVYGGTSLTKGADCSGFTMSVYAKFGVYLPHSSSAQSRCGTKVSASDIQPGDLIFYGSGSSVNHVALYIGGGQIVHASTERTGIKISNAFYRTPVTIRRVK